MKRALIGLTALSMLACGPGATPDEGDETTGDETVVEVVREAPPRQPPPESGPPRDVQFPDIARADAAGLDVNTVRFGDLPLILNGVMDPKTTAHGPNESMDLSIFRKAIATNVYLYDELSDALSEG